MINIFDQMFERQADFFRTLNIWSGRTVIEYGAQYCRHSMYALALGAKYAVGVEGRAENLAKVEVYSGGSWAGKLHTICQDIRHLPKISDFDIGLILGVLYHLDNPVSFLEEQLPYLKEGVIIWTHYTEQPNATQQGKSGLYYGANWLDPGQSNSDAIEPLTAFWFTRSELLRLLECNGFAVKRTEEMPTPVSPNYKGLMLYASRSA